MVCCGWSFVAAVGGLCWEEGRRKQTEGKAGGGPVSPWTPRYSDGMMTTINGGSYEMNKIIVTNSKG